MIKQTVSVIISTYNNPDWLEKTLWGYENQTYKDFDIVIADDGSREDTRFLIERFIHAGNLAIKQVWHPDDGFNKCAILNKAIMASTAEYLIFTDHDCIPREDFVKQHIDYSRKGYFLSGGYFKLPLDISQMINKDDICSGRVFNLQWLHSIGLKRSFKASKLFRSSLYANIMNKITPTKASWNGCNSSCWRKDAIFVNGFNEQMLYGAEDREFGDRLIHAGCKTKQLRYTCICVHLDHDRPYKKEEIKAQNVAIWKETIRNKTIKTLHGIEKN